MQRDLMQMKKLNSSFLSCGKDTELILRKLFIESAPYNEELIRLLVINTPDCLNNTTNSAYQKKIKEFSSLRKLFEEGYITTTPKIMIEENAQVQSYIIISFDNFIQSGNPKYRDCSINFDIICNTDCWRMDDYEIRPIKICGYIDGILNQSKLTGIGTLEFAGCRELILDNQFSGYSLTFVATHGSDDQIPAE